MSITLTLDQVRAMLACNKHRLDDELEIQPDMMQRIASRVVVMNSRMLEAKDDLARIEGRLTMDLREDNPKLTVDGVSATVRRHADRTRAWQKYQEARADHEEWSGVLEAWRQKGFSLKTLADLYYAQYFSVDSASLSQRQRDRMEHQDEARAEMRRASARAGGGQGAPDEAEQTTRRRVRI
jgi:hypothetical protein